MIDYSKQIQLTDKVEDLQNENSKLKDSRAIKEMDTKIYEQELTIFKQKFIIKEKNFIIEMLE